MASNSPKIYILFHEDLRLPTYKSPEGRARCTALPKNETISKLAEGRVSQEPLSVRIVKTLQVLNINSNQWRKSLEMNSYLEENQCGILINIEQTQIIWRR